jgi:Asp-tRNA(Asn)/Glu-tRNA(Gln) amidotransferase C subunit
MLQEIDTTWVEPTISVVSQVWTLRKDELIQKDALPSELLACSKQKVIWWQIAIWSIMH